MAMSANAPATLRGPAAVLWYLRFARDPLRAIAQSYATYGSFVRLPYRRARRTGKPRAFMVAIGPQFNREVLGNPTTWLPVNVGPPGPKNSASRRLGRGILGMTGRQHEHYRRLLLPPLQRNAVNALGADMMRLAEEQVDTWPLQEPIDLRIHAQALIRSFAIGLLFSDDRTHGFPIADMITGATSCNWSWKIFALPVDVPGTPYHQMLRSAEHLECRIIEWARHKRGQMEGRDLLSILVNSPDEDGGPASVENIVGQTPTLFGATHETCQNALVWTLLLLDQHPKIARDLYDELKGCGAGGLASYQQLVQSPLLDSIVNESMRILPPVPQQFRIADRDTTLNGYPVAERSKVMLSAFLTNREPELYPDADRFCPSRWANISPSSYGYSVFSGGPRGCPGYSFAASMLKVAVATILTRYRIALEPGTRIDYRVGVALTTRRAIPAVLHRQDGAFVASAIRGRIRSLVRFPN